MREHELSQFRFRWSVPGNIPKKELIGHDSKSPTVTFKRIQVIYQSLGTHIGRSAHIVVDLVLPCINKLAEAKISNLVLIIIDKYVSWFYISMDYAFSFEFLESLDYLEDDLEDLAL